MDREKIIDDISNMLCPDAGSGMPDMLTPSLSGTETALLSGVSSASFLLTLASAIILIMTVVFVVRYRKF